MTEAEWLEATDPMLMLEFLKGRASERKLRLFALACCRRMWHLLQDERGRTAVEVMERFVDGLESHQERSVAASTAWEAAHAAGEREVSGAIRGAALAAARVADRDWPLFCSRQPPNESAGTYAWTAVQDAAFAVDRQQRSAWLRDIFGHPFRPSTINVDWRTLNIVSLGEAIYHAGAFERLPVLAAELEAAGCRDAGILNHCHQSDGHVRGCWVIDWLLGKE